MNITQFDLARPKDLLAAAGDFSYPDRVDLEELEAELQEGTLVDSRNAPPTGITMNSPAQLVDVDENKPMVLTMNFQIKRVHDQVEQGRRVLDSLKKSDVFKGLTVDQYDEVVSCGIKKQLLPHGLLFHQGDPATHGYLVTRSQLKLTKLNEQGKEVIIRYIGVGELTAAVVVLKNGFYPVSAESIQETEVIGWDKSTMLVLMRRFPEIAINLLGIMLSRIDDVQQRYLEVCTEQVDQRIARSLLRLMRRAGSKDPDGILIDIPLSRQNIADYSGTTIYTVSRTLSAWEKKGWIKSGREKIMVTDPHALVAFAEGA